jgi:hypothetical protein
MISQILRWAALPVTDRRWAAPLCAVALGFGLFAGVAIGPGAAGTFATGAAQIIEIPGFGGGDGAGESDEGARVAQSTDAGSAGGGGSGGEAALPELPSSEFEGESAPAPEASPPSEEPAPPEEEGGGEPEPQVLAGTVVHVNAAAGSYTLAEPSGVLDVLHAGKPPQPGTKVSVPTRLLANGTFAEAGKRSRTGTRARASFSGIVTYVDPTAGAPAYTVSKRGASLLVHVHPDPSGAPPALPALGAFADVVVDIERVQPATEATPAVEATQEPATPAAPEPAPDPPACAPDPAIPLPEAKPSAVLWQRQVSAAGAPFTYGDFAGIVTAVCADSGQLLISADDIRESAHDLSFSVPTDIEPSKVTVGQSVLASATIAADGSLALTGLASDERRKGADNVALTQGDLVPSNPR